MGHFCINRSGKNLTVTRVNNGGECVGTIAPNEVFVWTGAWSGNGVEGADSQAVFFKKNGIFFETGWINGAIAIGGLTPLVHCSLYDVDTGMGNGVESVFQTKYPVKHTAILKDGSKVLISKNKKKDFMEVFTKYVGLLVKL